MHDSTRRPQQRKYATYKINGKRKRLRTIDSYETWEVMYGPVAIVFSCGSVLWAAPGSLYTMLLFGSLLLYGYAFQMNEMREWWKEIYLLLFLGIVFSRTFERDGTPFLVLKLFAAAGFCILLTGYVKLWTRRAMWEPFAAVLAFSGFVALVRFRILDLGGWERAVFLVLLPFWFWLCRRIFLASTEYEEARYSGISEPDDEA